MTWRPCPGWSDFEVSDDGQIRRIRGPKCAKLMTLRALHVASQGYVTTHLSQDGRAAHVSLHALICEAFHGPRPSKRHQVAHWDGNKTNNSATNLRWVLPPENYADTKRHDRHPIGERSGHAKVTAEQVLEIRSLHQSAGRRRNGRLPGIIVTLADRFGVKKSTIKNIVYGACWKHLLPEPPPDAAPTPSAA